MLLDLGYEQYSARGLIERIADRRNASGVLSNAPLTPTTRLGPPDRVRHAYDPADRGFAYDAMGNLTRNGDRYVATSRIPAGRISSPPCGRQPERARRRSRTT